MTKDFAKKHRTGRSDGHACREMLDEIRRMTFLLEDKPDIIQNLRHNLDRLSAGLNNSVPRENGIPLRKEEVKVVKISKNNDFRFMTLPQRKRKAKFAGRVGEKKEKILHAIDININTG